MLDFDYIEEYLRSKSNKLYYGSVREANSSSVGFQRLIKYQ